jgi:hypothetical protein
MDAERIAEVCHEANRVLTRFAGDVPVQAPWASIDEDMRQSSIKGVRFTLENPDVTPEELHEAWCAERRSQGWVFGETKDAEKKRHPALRPFAELPEGTRIKDAVFRAVVKALSP